MCEAMLVYARCVVEPKMSRNFPRSPKKYFCYAFPSKLLRSPTRESVLFCFLCIFVVFNRQYFVVVLSCLRSGRKCIATENCTPWHEKYVFIEQQSPSECEISGKYNLRTTKYCIRRPDAAIDSQHTSAMRIFLPEF